MYKESFITTEKVSLIEVICRFKVMFGDFTNIIKTQLKSIVKRNIPIIKNLGHVIQKLFIP